MKKDLTLYQVNHGDERIYEVHYENESAYEGAINIWDWVQDRISYMPYIPIEVVETLDEALDFGYAIYDESDVELYCSAADEDPNSIS